MGIQPHKRDIGPDQPPQAPPARVGVAGALAVAALLGAVLGAVVGALVLPELIVACAIGGALLLAAGRVAVLMSADRKGLAPVDDEDGTMQ